MKRIVQGLLLIIFLIYTVFLITGAVKEVLKTNREIGETTTRIKLYEEKVLAVTLQDIDKPDSVHMGRWVGLCKKDSIKSIDDFYQQVMSDPILTQHFSDFRWGNAVLTKEESEVVARVAHRAGATIKLTSKPIHLPAGDVRITDGKRTVRAHCCNDIATEPPAVVEPPKTVVTEPPVYTFSEPAPPEIIYPPVSMPAYGRGTGYHNQASPVPEPTTMLLVGSGLITLALYGRRKK